MARASLARKNRERAKTVGRTWGDWQGRPFTEEEIQTHPHLRNCSLHYFNNRYDVTGFRCSSPIGGIWQVMVSRHYDLEPITWEELQRIKNECFGPHALALEMYPPADVEWKPQSNVRVLYVMPTDFIPPFGLHLESAWGNPSAV
jgi:hypothetical protein